MKRKLDDVTRKLEVLYDRLRDSSVSINRSNFVLHRGSYMSAHVLLNELGKNNKMRGLLSILLLFGTKFNKFHNKGAQMLDSIYHMT